MNDNELKAILETVRSRLSASAVFVGLIVGEIGDDGPTIGIAWGHPSLPPVPQAQLEAACRAATNGIASAFGMDRLPDTTDGKLH
jgi:hypothetical protein